MDTVSLRLQEKALEWLLTLESDNRLDTRRAFLEWCEVSREHVQAFLEVTVLDRQLGRIDPQGSVDLDALVAECRRLPNESIVALGGAAVGQQRSERQPSRRVRWGLAAAIVLVLLGLASARWGHLSPADYTTQVGEQRSVKLQDGSLVYLNTRSRIQERYSNDAREIDLLAGEAYFIVAQDRVRPFRVLAGDATVQAIGTEFNVYREDERTTVSVVQGKVQVATAAKALPLGAGEAAQVLEGKRILKQADAEVGHATAWRQRQLDFRRAALFEVVAEFNRYNTTQLEVADREVGERRLNAVFDADAPEQLLRFLEERGDVRVERRGKTIVIHATKDAH